MEQHYGHKNPVNSVTKLHAILTRCPSRPQHLEWVMVRLWDSLRSGLFDPKTLSVSCIKGTANGNKGLVSLLLLKKDLNEYFHNEVLAKMDFSAQAKTHLAKVFEDTDSYRQRLKALPDIQLHPDLDWAVGFSKADCLLRDFWEAMAMRI